MASHRPRTAPSTFPTPSDDAPLSPNSLTTTIPLTLRLLTLDQWLQLDVPTHWTVKRLKLEAIRRFHLVENALELDESIRAAKMGPDKSKSKAKGKGKMKEKESPVKNVNTPWSQRVSAEVGLLESRRVAGTRRRSATHVPTKSTGLSASAGPELGRQDSAQKKGAFKIGSFEFRKASSDSLFPPLSPSLSPLHIPQRFLGLPVHPHHEPGFAHGPTTPIRRSPSHSHFTHDDSALTTSPVSFLSNDDRERSNRRSSVPGYPAAVLLALEAKGLLSTPSLVNLAQNVEVDEQPSSIRSQSPCDDRGSTMTTPSILVSRSKRQQEVEAELVQTMRLVNAVLGTFVDSNSDSTVGEKLIGNDVVNVLPSHLYFDRPLTKYIEPFMHLPVWIHTKGSASTLYHPKGASGVWKLQMLVIDQDRCRIMKGRHDTKVLHDYRLPCLSVKYHARSSSTEFVLKVWFGGEVEPVYMHAASEGEGRALETVLDSGMRREDGDGGYHGSTAWKAQVTILAHASRCRKPPAPPSSAVSRSSGSLARQVTLSEHLNMTSADRNGSRTDTPSSRSSLEGTLLSPLSSPLGSPHFVASSYTFPSSYTTKVDTSTSSDPSAPSVVSSPRSTLLSRSGSKGAPAAVQEEDEEALATPLLNTRFHINNTPSPTQSEAASTRGPSRLKNGAAQEEERDGKRESHALPFSRRGSVQNSSITSTLESTGGKGQENLMSGSQIRSGMGTRMRSLSNDMVDLPSGIGLGVEVWPGQERQESSLGAGLERAGSRKRMAGRWDGVLVKDGLRRQASLSQLARR